MVAKKISSLHDDVVVGSMGALFAKRPGEMKDFRTSQVICIDGCATSCASILATARGLANPAAVLIPSVVLGVERDEDRITATITAVKALFIEDIEDSPSKEAQEAEITEDYLAESFDKFILKVKKGLRYSDNDFWAAVENDSVRVGASDFLQQMMSDVYFIELADIGTRVQIFDDVGAMESTKIMVEIIVPLSGTIVECNMKLEDSPELINEDPYGEGWLYMIRPDDLSELELLKTDLEYMEHALVKAKAEIGGKVED